MRSFPSLVQGCSPAKVRASKIFLWDYLTTSGFPWEISGWSFRLVSFGTFVLQRTLNVLLISEVLLRSIHDFSGNILVEHLLLRGTVLRLKPVHLY
jgi:hypothetical protein